MRSQGSLDRVRSHGLVCESGKGLEIAALPQGRAGFLEDACAEQWGRRRPDDAVAVRAVAPELRADGDQLGEVEDRLRAPLPGHAHEPVGIEVVAEEEGGVAVGRSEESRPPVVDEVPLVDRLQPERKPFLAQRREDRSGLALVLRTQRLGPDGALAPGLVSDRVPEAL